MHATSYTNTGLILIFDCSPPWHHCCITKNEGGNKEFLQAASRIVTIDSKEGNSFLHIGHIPNYCVFLCFLAVFSADPFFSVDVKKSSYLNLKTHIWQKPAVSNSWARSVISVYILTLYYSIVYC